MLFLVKQGKAGHNLAMKKTRLLFAFCLAGLLSSCSIYDLVNSGLPYVPGGNSNIVTDPLQKKTLEVFDLKKYGLEQNASSNLATYKVGNLPVYYPTGKEEVLYVTFADYCDHLTRYFGTNYSGSVSGSGSAPVWNVKKGSSLVYQIELSVSSSSFTVGGGLYGVDKLTKDYSRSSLSLAMSTRQETLDRGSTYVTRSFRCFQTPLYFYNSTYYFPLALLEAEIGKGYGSWHFHDFQRLYRYDDREQLGLDFILDNKETSVEKNINAYIDEKKTMPEGLRKLDADVVYYTFETQYGLLAQRGLASGKTALDSINAYSRLTSADTLTRQKALYESFALFDDDHTGVYPAHGAMWGETTEGYVRGQNSLARSQVSKTLKEARASWLEGLGKTAMDVLYQDDMAYFSFDSFKFAQEAYVGDTTALRDDLYVDDSYYYFLHQFSDIQSHNGIKDVVIDISLNGGGTVGILYKLCALLSRDNSSRMAYMISNSGTKYTVTSRVDVNGDGQYSDDETFGGKYNFYLLTSSMSFSCGNAFPFLMRKQGFAKVVGANSGGGECTVDSSFLPSGHGFVFSSMNHIGYVARSSTVFFGDEGGSGVDIPLAYESFYDLAALRQAIHS